MNLSLTRWIFLRALAIVYLVAFLSLRVQLSGLAGEQGILPSVYGTQTLNLVCGAAIAVSGALLIGLAPLLCLVILWGAYGFLARECGEFLWFQWDALMLEMGLLAIFLAPLTWMPRPWTRANEETRPSLLVIWLFRWLLFRVMFFSGYVKLASGDPNWRNLTALRYHFETQPLPTWLGWGFHQLPLAALKACALGMFAIELVVPFLIFLPRKARFIAFWLFIALQLLIDATGNYGFFGWQVCSLCLLLLDDDAILYAARRLGLGPARLPCGPARPEPRAKQAINACVAAAVLAVSLFHFRPAMEALAPLHSINSYGVFAVMTTERDEIQIEGSNDGKDWKAYEFKWKPGALDRRPGFVEPHMPRLDWQMWFAALGTVRENPWFVSFMIRLLQGMSPVLGLLEKNPFPEAPPKWVRATLYQYRFSRPGEPGTAESWWRRESKGVYAPPLSLDMLK